MTESGGKALLSAPKLYSIRRRIYSDRGGDNDCWTEQGLDQGANGLQSKSDQRSGAFYSNE